MRMILFYLETRYNIGAWLRYRVSTVPLTRPRSPSRRPALVQCGTQGHVVMQSFILVPNYVISVKRLSNLARVARMSLDPIISSKAPML